MPTASRRGTTSANRLLGVMLTRSGIPEIDECAAAFIMRDKSVELRHYFRSHPVECRDQVMDIFRIEPFGKRADQFADKYRQLALFELIEGSPQLPRTYQSPGREKCFRDGRRGMLAARGRAPLACRPLPASEFLRRAPALQHLARC